MTASDEACCCRMIRRAPHRELSLGRYAKKGQSRALSQGQEPHIGAGRPASLYKDQTAEVLAYEVLALHDRMNKVMQSTTAGSVWTSWSWLYSIIAYLQL